MLESFMHSRLAFCASVGLLALVNVLISKLPMQGRPTLSSFNTPNRVLGRYAMFSRYDIASTRQYLVFLGINAASAGLSAIFSRLETERTAQRTRYFRGLILRVF